MKEDDIHIVWDSIPAKMPDYNRFSIETQKKATEIGNRIAVSRFDLDALLEIYNTPFILETFKKHQFLILAANALNFKYIVNISKFYNPKEVYSLDKFLNILINNYKKIRWYSQLELAEIRNLKSELEQSNADILIEIKKLRDKNYAHDEGIIDLSLRLIDLISVQKTLEDVYNTLRFPLDGNKILFDKQEDKSLGALVHKILNFDKLYNELLDPDNLELASMKHSDILTKLKDKTYI